MFSASDLTAEQIETIKSWVAEGDQMSDVQRRLKDDLGLNVTYMDTRFLSLDLDLAFESEEEDAADEDLPPEAHAPPSGDPVEGDSIGGTGAGTAGEDDLEFTPGLQPVSVTVDSLARPGAMVSGGVVFSDGEKGTWMIDSQGRPSIDPETTGYRPSEADLVEFQMQLREKLEKQV